jgi:hypothetical protein
MGSNTLNFAQRELDILVKSSTDPDNRPIIEDFIPEILALVDKFGNSGQSGGSAPYVASALSQTISKLCMQQPICPITGLDEEWMDVTEQSDGEILFQNTRCYALFKTGKDKKPYFLDAIVWRDEEGMTWTGSAFVPNPDGGYHKIFSRQTIKNFPFEPQHFYVDVITKKVDDGTEWYVKNSNQLEEAFQYYEKPY